MCDHCVVLLLDDLERAGALLPAIREQLRGINASSVVWARLHRLNASIADLQVLPGPARPPQPPLPRSQALTFPSPQSQLRKPPGPRHEIAQQLEALERQTSSLGQDVRQLDGQAGPRGALPQNPPPGTLLLRESPSPGPRPFSRPLPKRPLSPGPKPSSVTPDPQLRLEA